MSNEKKIKIKNLLLALNAEQLSKQLEAVSTLKVIGDESVIEPLVQVLSTTEEEELQLEIKSLLDTLKSTKAPSIIADCLVNPSYVNVRAQLLSSIWNSGLDYRPYLKEIMMATLEGEMAEALECLTIIENMEGSFSEEQLFEPLILLREYLVVNQNNKDHKTELLIEVLRILQELNDNN